jgi:dihydrodipicolinate synthase/N-acetylneuraminate lyase
MEPNPVPLKVALAAAKVFSTEDVRLPLCPMGPASRAALAAALKAAGR